MHIGVIGLGKMGANIARRLMRGGHEVTVFDLDPEAIKELGEEGAHTSTSLENLIEKLPTPRTIWIMVPAGGPVDSTIGAVKGHLAKGDALVEGGNSDYRESMARAELLAADGIDYIDVGTSGGVWGLTEGYAMMIGGKEATVERIRPAFETLAPAKDKGWNYMGSERLGSLRQDGPQRHRVRPHAGLRRGLRADEVED